MATQTTTNPASNSSRLQTYLSRALLKPLSYNLKLGDLDGVVQNGVDVPGSNGGLTIRFHKVRRADAANVSTLTEGTPISTFSEVNFGYVDATLTQKGTVGKISDVLQAVDIFNLVDTNKERLGADFAKKLDDDIHISLVSGMQNLDTVFEQFAGVPSSGGTQDGSAQFTDLAALNNAAGKMTGLEVLKAVTTMRANSVPEVPGGGYRGVVGPLAMFDLRQDDDWKKVAQYQRADDLRKWGEWNFHGVRFVESDNVFGESTTYGTRDTAAPTIYSTYVFGAGAYGVPGLKGTKRAGGKVVSPAMFLLNEADKSDPLNQTTLVGFKCLYVAKLLKTNLTGDVPYLVNIRSRSTYNG